MTELYTSEINDLMSSIYSICSEYADNKAEKIYIYCYSDSEVMLCDFFFKYNGKILDRNELSDMLGNAVKHEPFYQDIYDSIFCCLASIKELCREHKIPMWSEAKMTGDAEHICTTKYTYDVVHPFEHIDTVISEWFKEIKRATESEGEFLPLKH